MIKLFKDKAIDCKRIKIPRKDGKSVPALILSLKGKKDDKGPGILWIHGGGYMIGMKEMVHMSRAVDLVKKYNATVISPGYRLSFMKPYPAAIDDCYDALIFLKNHAEDYGYNRNQLMVGGESAGGGLCAAVCMMARDRGEVNIAFQMPLYPMLDNFDTESSRDNHGKVWNTRRNHMAWKVYLRKNVHDKVSPYASPARQTDYSNLPPAYTFVGAGEPFFAETCTYIDNLKAEGISAKMHVYKTNMHAFDMLKPNHNMSKKAIKRFLSHFKYAVNTYYADNQ